MMPRSTDPDYQVEIVLDHDIEKDPQPTFLFKTPSMRVEQRISELFDTILEGESGEIVTKLKTELGLSLKGWKNMGSIGEYTEPDQLVDLLDTAEAMQLARKLLASGRLSDEEKKRQESLDSSDADSSANTAQAAAEIVQPKNPD